MLDSQNLEQGRCKGEARAEVAQMLDRAMAEKLSDLVSGIDFKDSTIVALS
jgi:hypothetical protein